ncbi:serine o-acetyltransferase : Serine acetyltransferase OS=Singulisphaera acidiphila (strain ATCC BAA-1392 / DSM 18658 / VKM B-2454 / MOB10) GN=Sinac_6197 PE=4 SV=1: Hexapep [Gemmataceae bacterium]|nr:serine o-acetyltransferase : Serine acetyltransferase OS=Singulisphaera acidiphila (strain ATCC BAA-1392 / DSM 18658 / VKM B-2454 / MOB10) GN=Sinac_6197 PE=4 SV=1: Hexapep [Gemmataceae bacterium]VTU01359.1 serine o-acetyltransferase : Serine acetyltransferase OS=Singulisphaera acidiphila (strain ATCC BAA-1392 / DSM 18658 / VKM B-2454 / MOB10) GN=Sinac_6197 PE=4 SV=1: Hexapep [Gemmataceae bacterium]
MATDIRLKEELPTVTDLLVETYTECSRLNHLGHEPLPSRDAVAEIVADLYEVLYPGYGKRQNLHIGNIAYYVGSIIDALHDKLTNQIARALRHELCEESPHVDCEKMAQPKAVELLRRLPDIRKVLEQDVDAAYRGDPAARTHHEVIFSYPGLEAITVYRVAHELYRLGVPFIPRMMTEFAHSKTGIDIHPGATIGPGFFIDHGTGVVIGETTEIGVGVKVYQGVTLGALSFTKDDDGELLKGSYKRHPTLRDGVVVYANATILGGNTVVGERAVIGSNVWLTESVPPDTTVVLEKPRLRLRGAKLSHEPLTYEI